MQTIEYPIKRLISEARLSSYVTRNSFGNLNGPIKTYKWNTQLSECLYPLLQTVEVGLRNAINESVSDHYKDPYWILNEYVLEPIDSIIVQKQKNKLSTKQETVPIGKIIADLNFGFWTSLLDASYEEKLWRTTILKNTFPYMGKEARTRKNVSRTFSKIRRLRNRVFHYEPIWHWKDLLQQHDMIVEAIYWMEPKLLTLIPTERFREIYVPESLHRNGIKNSVKKIPEEV